MKKLFLNLKFKLIDFFSEKKRYNYNISVYAEKDREIEDKNTLCLKK